MVFINDQKFACESCIKGHRSSSCAHNDRPLFEVKKKGRPVSQCEKCRDLRKTKRVHSKCICETEKPEKAMKLLSAKSKRYIPILPSLPNGLRDAFVNSNCSDMPPSDPRARVDTLLNPCNCKDVWNCNCSATDDAPVASSSRSSSENGLATLALAAASLCCSSTPVKDPTPESCRLSSQKHPRDGCKPSPKARSKRLRRQQSPEGTPAAQRGPVLPPILPVSLVESSSATPGVPTFPTIPPLSSIVSLAGSGCTCGFDCSCPGCVEHRGLEHASHEHGDCPDGCSTCIDIRLGVELPVSTSFGCILPSNSGSAGAVPDYLEAFFAKAASIPPPPPERASARNLDPMNVTVYPKSLFSGEPNMLDTRGPAFGLVQLPKLECCAGRCGCLGGTCGCGQTCDGCCEEHNGEVDTPREVVDAATNELSPDSPIEENNPVIRSCCAGKAIQS